MSTPVLEVLPTHTPGSPEWHESRMGGLGGSEVAAVLGLSPWVSRFALWHYKAGILQPADEDNEYTLWGRLLEEPIRRRYAALHPEVQVITAGPYRRTDRTWQIASPDGIATGAPGTWIVECKTAQDDYGWGAPGTDEVPIYYRTQVQWYLDCLELQRADIAVLIRGSDFREYTVWHDETDAQLLRDAAEEFMASITAGQRPDVDEHSVTYSAVRELHPAIDDLDVEIGDELARLFIDACAGFRDAEARKQLAYSRLADVMGTARRARYAKTTLATRQARGDGLPYLVAGRKLPILTDKAA